jgi:hypothetical protein
MSLFTTTAKRTLSFAGGKSTHISSITGNGLS